MKVIISLSSNYRQQENVIMAEGMLRAFFSAIVFSSRLMTKPVGMKNEELFCNIIASGETTLPYPALRCILKNIEKTLGRTSKQKKEGKIIIDLDILLFGEKKFKLDDWSRDFNKVLLKEVGENL